MMIPFHLYSRINAFRILTAGLDRTIPDLNFEFAQIILFLNSIFNPILIFRKGTKTIDEYCRNAILSQSAVPHCKWLCMDSIVLCSVIGATLSWV